MCIVVAQKLWCLDDVEFRWYFKRRVYWLPIQTVCIVLPIDEHPISVSLFLTWAQRWLSMESQRFIFWHIQQSPAWIVASVQRRCIGHLTRYNGKHHPPCPIIVLSVNDFWTSIRDNLWAVQEHIAIIRILPTCFAKNTRDDITTTSSKRVLTELWWFLVLHLG